MPTGGLQDSIGISRMWAARGMNTIPPGASRRTAITLDDRSRPTAHRWRPIPRPCTERPRINIDTEPDSLRKP